MYVVGNRHANVERDGKLVTLNPGDPIPEAAEWPHDVRMRCMKIGQIVTMKEVDTKPQPALARKLGPSKASTIASVKPSSTSEVNNGKPKKGKSTAARKNKIAS